MCFLGDNNKPDLISVTGNSKPQPWEKDLQACAESSKYNPILISFMAAGKQANWVTRKTWKLRLWLTGYDKGVLFTVQQFIVPLYRPIPVGPNSTINSLVGFMGLPLPRTVSLLNNVIPTKALSQPRWPIIQAFALLSATYDHLNNSQLNWT